MLKLMCRLIGQDGTVPSLDRQNFVRTFTRMLRNLLRLQPYGYQE